MNIGLVTSSFPLSRDDSVQAPFLVPFMEGLLRRGHRVFVFTQDRSGKKEPVLGEVEVRWFPWAGSDRPLVHLNPLRPGDALRIGSLFFNGGREIVRFMRERRVDACLALWALPGGYLANRAFREAGIPYSVWTLGSDIYKYGANPLLYPLLKRIVGEARSVYGDGFDLCRRVEDRFGRSCAFLATARPLSVTPPEPAGHDASGPYRFLYVGRFERVKGLDLLLEAAAILKEEGVGLHLTLVGGGSLEPWARRFVAEKGLLDRVTLAGRVPDEALTALYAASDCVVIPSRSESIPLVFSEALRSRLDLVVTDVGDMGTLGRDYGVAEVVPPENPGALKEAMGRMVRGERTCKRFEEKRAELARLFDIETSVERFLADYS
jgi:glycosyltransferase involved in cell wall biosynthesis